MPIRNRRKRTTFIRLLSAFLAVAFTGQTLALAAGDLKPLHLSAEGEKVRLPYRIPSSVARVEDSYKGPAASKTIFLLQDAHTNESGQLNLAKTLDILLSNEKDLHTVFAEGAAGDNSLSFLRAAKPLEERRSLARSYIRKGLLHGAEYLDLTSDHTFTIWGVEKPELYIQSLEQYRSAAKDRDRFELYLKRIRISYESLSNQLVSPALMAILRRSDRFASGELPMTEYFEELSSDAVKFGVQLDDFHSLALLRDLKTREGLIDFKKANEEEARAIETLSVSDREVLKEAEVKADASTFSPGMEDPHQGYFSLLEEKLAGHLADFPELFKYFDYLKAAEKIDAPGVFAEQRALENALVEKAASSDDERTFADISRMIRLYDKLFRLTLTPSNYVEYQSLKDKLSIDRLTGFLNKKIMDLDKYHEHALFLEPGYEDILASCEKFYTLTSERDQNFVKEMTRRMDETGETRAALVTGGFHTVNLKALLKERGISYVSITPQVLRETNLGRYEQILLNQRMPEQSVPMTMRVSSIAETYARAQGTRLPFSLLKSDMLSELGATTGVIPPVTQTEARGSRLAKGNKLAGVLPDSIQRYWQARDPWTKDTHPAKAELLAREDRQVEAIAKYVADKKLKNAKIVEFAAGTGPMTLRLALIEGVAEIVVVDINAKALAILRENVRKLQAEVEKRRAAGETVHMAKITVIEGDLYSPEAQAEIEKFIPATAEGAADVTLISDAWMHLRSPAIFTDLAWQRLKPGGLFLANTVSVEGNEWRWRYLWNHKVGRFLHKLSVSPLLKWLNVTWVAERLGLRTYPLKEEEVRSILSGHYRIVNLVHSPSEFCDYWEIAAEKIIPSILGSRLSEAAVHAGIWQLNNHLSFLFVKHALRDPDAYRKDTLSQHVIDDLKGAFKEDSLKAINEILYESVGKKSWVFRGFASMRVNNAIRYRAEQLIDDLLKERIFYAVENVTDLELLNTVIDMIQGFTFSWTHLLQFLSPKQKADQKNENLFLYAKEFSELILLLPRKRQAHYRNEFMDKMLQKREELKLGTKTIGARIASTDELLTGIAQNANKALGYFGSGNNYPGDPGLILWLGNHDARVFGSMVDYWKRLDAAGKAPKILLSGGRGRATDYFVQNIIRYIRSSRKAADFSGLSDQDLVERWKDLSEAEIAQAVLTQVDGVPPQFILLETESANTPQNYQKSRAIISELIAKGQLKADATLAVFHALPHLRRAQVTGEEELSGLSLKIVAVKAYELDLAKDLAAGDPSFIQNAVRLFGSSLLGQEGELAIFDRYYPAEAKKISAEVRAAFAAGRKALDELLTSQPKWRAAVSASLQSQKSTLLSKEQKDQLVATGGNLLRAFLQKLAPYADDPANSPYKDIAGVTPLWEAVKEFKRDPKLFSDEALVKRTGTQMPRIEVRGSDPRTGQAAQVAIIGIPGDYRADSVEVLKQLPETKNLSIRVAGFATLEATVDGVDKGLAVQYIDGHLEEILDAAGYRPGPFIDARKTRTVILSDGDGTLYGASTATDDPLLWDSKAREALLDYLRAGGVFILVSGGNLELVTRRLLENNAIPQDLRSNFIVIANGAANLAVFGKDGKLVEVEAYRKNALSELKPGKVSRLDAIYLGDDEKPIGNDYPAGIKLGFDRFVSVSPKPASEVPQELRQNHVGSHDKGTAAVLRAARHYAVTHPLSTIYDPKGIASIIGEARKELGASVGSRIADRLASRVQEGMLKVFGDKKKLDKAVHAEAVETGRTDFAVGRGIVGREKNSQDDEWFMARSERGPPSNFLVVGGGGEGTTTFAEATVNRFKHLAYKLYKKLFRREYAAVNSHTFDDGGNTWDVRIYLHDSPNWPNDVAPLVGDYISIISYLTGDPAKIFILDDVFRMNGIVNINTANKGILIRLFDEETAEKILAERKRVGRFTNVSQIESLVPKHVYEVVKKNLRLEGDHKVSVVDFVLERLREAQDKIDRGTMKRPADWAFFVANMIAVAHLVEDNFIKTGDIKLIGAKWQNLMMLGFLVDAGFIKRGDQSIHPDKDPNKIYEALGIPVGYVRSVTNQDATLVAILEAGAFRISKEDGTQKEAVLFGKVGDSIVIRKVEVDQAGGDIIATALAGPGHERLAEGQSIVMKLADQDVTFTNERGVLKVSVKGKDLYLSEDKNWEAKTRLTLDGQDTDIRVDGDWHNIGGLPISIKSRRVEEQTFITDEVLSARVTKVILVGNKGKDGRYQYEKNPDGTDKVNEKGRKLRKFTKLKKGEGPSISTQTRDMIRETRRAIVYGESGMVTSILPNFLVNGTAEEIRAKIEQGLPAIFFPKLVQDFETMGLSLREQIELMDRSIREVTGGQYGFSDLVTDIILPQITPEAKAISDHFIEEARRDMKDPKVQEELRTRVKKISKYYPLPLQDITPEDEEYLRSKGIRIHYVSNFDINSKNKLVYQKEELQKTIHMIATREAILALVKDETVRNRLREEFMGSRKDNVADGELFWPMSDWHKLFEAALQHSGLPRERVTYVFDEGLPTERVFHVDIPRISSLPESLQEIAGEYLATTLYNPLVSLGAKTLTIHSSKATFGLINKTMALNGQKDFYQFLSLYHQSPFRPKHSTQPFSERAASKKSTGISIPQKDQQKGTFLGIAVTEGSFDLVLIKDGTILKHVRTTNWDPSSFDHGTDFTEYFNKAVRDFLRDAGISLKDVEAVGVSWPALIKDGRIVGRGTIRAMAPKFDKMTSKEFDQEVGGLQDDISKALGGKRVVFHKDGDAASAFHLGQGAQPNTLFFGMNERLSASYSDSESRISPIVAEIGNVVIDTNAGAARHSITGVKGALQQYLSKPGLLRLARGRLMGDLKPGTVTKELGQSYEEAVVKYKEDLKRLGMTAEELLFKDRSKMLSDERRVYDAIISEAARSLSTRLGRLSGIYKISIFLLPSEAYALDSKGEFTLTGKIGMEAIRAIAFASENLLGKNFTVVPSDDLTLDMVVKEWQKKNPQALKIFQGVSKYLAEAVLESQRYLPELQKVVIEGEIILPGIGEIIAEEANRILRENGKNVKIEPILVFGAKERAQGAAYLASSGARVATQREVLRAVDSGSLAAREIGDELKSKLQDPTYIANIVVATGETQKPMYRELVKRKDIDWSRVHIWHLDEYENNDVHQDVYKKELMERLVEPLRANGQNVPDSNLHFIADYVRKGRPSKMLAEYIKDLKTMTGGRGADIVVLGIGTDGHIAFNMPGSSRNSTIGRVKLTAKTVAANKLDPSREWYAYSMGIADILSGQKIFLLANGSGKAEIIQKALEGPVTDGLPASHLQKHPNVTVIVDNAAASKFSSKVRMKAMSQKDIEAEMKAAGKVSEQLHTVLDAKGDAERAKVFTQGGFKKDGYGVSEGAAVDGNFAIDGEGNQGYFVNGGKEKYLAVYKAMVDFFERRKAANGGKPIRYVLKLGIGGQHTPFEGIASAFQLIDTVTGKVVGEYEMGKDYEASITAVLKENGIGWNQVAVIPSSKSGSTDETMMIFVEILYVFLKNVAQEQGLDGKAFADAVLKTLHDVNFIGGKERAGGDLFKMDAERFGNKTLLDLVAENTGLSLPQVTDIFGKVLGNMFFETTDNPQESRLSAFIRNSGLDKQLGQNAPGFGAMFENVGGRWTADLHMLTFLAFHRLDAEKYWQIRNTRVRELRANKGKGFELGNRILDTGVTDIALVVPDELFWWGKSIEQNFNESIWQEGFANLVTVPESAWQAHEKNYRKDGRPGRLVINLSRTAISDTDFDVEQIGDLGLSAIGSDKQKLAGIFAELTSIFYAMTHTVGNRTIARAIRRAGHDINSLDINNLGNPATRVLQENLYVRQPYVELGKGLLEERLKALQAQGPQAVRDAYEAIVAEAKKTEAQGPQAVLDAVQAAVREAEQSGRKLVLLFYLHGQLFTYIRDAAINGGAEWVMQGTGDQHISYQQVLAQPQKYHVLMVDFVAENPQPGRPAVGFAKGYLDQISPNLVRSFFAEASFRALTELRKEQGGSGTFLRLTESRASVDIVLDALRKAALGAQLVEGRVSEELVSGLITWKKERSGRPVVSAFFGEPGSGKGTDAVRFMNQTNAILDRLDPQNKSGRVVQISTGEIFRGISKLIEHWNKNGRQAPVPAELQAFIPYASLVTSEELALMKQGGFIPDSAVARVVSKVLEQPENKSALLIIFDGFPRTVGQLSLFTEGKLMMDGRPVFLNFHYILDVDDITREEVIQSQVQRAIEDLEAGRPDREDARYKIVDGKKVVDVEATVAIARGRVETFIRQTKPVLDAVRSLKTTIVAPARIPAITDREKQIAHRLQMFLDGLQKIISSRSGSRVAAPDAALRKSVREDQVFNYIGGMNLDPLVAVLNDSGLLSFINDRKTITGEEFIAKAIQLKGNANEGYVLLALHRLYLAGWLDKSGSSDPRKAVYKLTAEGALGIEQAHLFSEVFRLMPTVLTMQDFLFDRSRGRAPPDSQVVFQELVAKAMVQWNIHPVPGNEQARERLVKRLDGSLISPVWIHLRRQSDAGKIKIDLEKPFKVSSLNGNLDALRTAFDLAQVVGWVEVLDADTVQFTRRGRIAWDMAQAFGVPVSYAPMHSKEADLLFSKDPQKVFVRDLDGNETHVFRQMNVDGSADSHKAYFKAAADAAAAYFSSLPPGKRPRFIADVGGAGGEFAASIFERLKAVLTPEELADMHVVIGDFNSEAMTRAKGNLIKAGVNPNNIHLVFADIIEPEAFEATVSNLMKPFNISSADGFFMSSMLIHNRPIRLPDDEAEIARVEKARAGKAHSEHVWVSSDGRLVPNGWLQQNLVDILSRWGKVASRHGFLMIDFHIPPASVVRGKPTTGFSYLNQHGPSGQYPVEYRLLADEAVKEAGMKVLSSARFPSSGPEEETAVSVLHLRLAETAGARVTAAFKAIDELLSKATAEENESSQLQLFENAKNEMVAVLAKNDPKLTLEIVQSWVETLIAGRQPQFAAEVIVAAIPVERLRIDFAVVDGWATRFTTHRAGELDHYEDKAADIIAAALIQRIDGFTRDYILAMAETIQKFSWDAASKIIAAALSDPKYGVSAAVLTAWIDRVAAAARHDVVEKLMLAAIKNGLAGLPEEKVNGWLSAAIQAHFAGNAANIIVAALRAGQVYGITAERASAIAQDLSTNNQPDLVRTNAALKITDALKNISGSRLTQATFTAQALDAALLSDETVGISGIAYNVTEDRTETVRFADVVKIQVAEWTQQVDLTARNRDGVARAWQALKEAIPGGGPVPGPVTVFFINPSSDEVTSPPQGARLKTPLLLMSQQQVDALVRRFEGLIEENTEADVEVLGRLLFGLDNLRGLKPETNFMGLQTLRGNILETIAFIEELEPAGPIEAQQHERIVSALREIAGSTFNDQPNQIPFVTQDRVQAYIVAQSLAALNEPGVEPILGSLIAAIRSGNMLSLKEIRTQLDTVIRGFEARGDLDRAKDLRTVAGALPLSLMRKEGLTDLFDRANGARIAGENEKTGEVNTARLALESSLQQGFGARIRAAFISNLPAVDVSQESESDVLGSRVASKTPTFEGIDSQQLENFALKVWAAKDRKVFDLRFAVLFSDTNLEKFSYKMDAGALVLYHHADRFGQPVEIVRVENPQDKLKTLVQAGSTSMNDSDVFAAIRSSHVSAATHFSAEAFPTNDSRTPVLSIIPLSTLSELDEREFDAQVELAVGEAVMIFHSDKVGFAFDTAGLSAEKIERAAAIAAGADGYIAQPRAFKGILAVFVDTHPDRRQNSFQAQNAVYIPVSRLESHNVAGWGRLFLLGKAVASIYGNVFNQDDNRILYEEVKAEDIDKGVLSYIQDNLEDAGRQIGASQALDIFRFMSFNTMMEYTIKLPILEDLDLDLIVAAGKRMARAVGIAA